MVKGLRRFITNKNIAALLKPFEHAGGVHPHALTAQLDSGKDIYVTANDECWCLTTSTAAIVPGLHSNQEEADTKMLSHASQGFQKTVTHTLQILIYS